VLELVGVSRACENGDENVWIKLDNPRLVMVIIAECVQPPQTPRLIPSGSSSAPVGITSMIRSLPGLGLI
jgi:hypothetical protein